MHKIDEIRTVEVLDVKKEAVDITSIYFKDEIVCSSKPGQYLMVWVPGEDEVPMSISTIEEKGLSSITVRKVGNTTEILSFWWVLKTEKDILKLRIKRQRNI